MVTLHTFKHTNKSTKEKYEFFVSSIENSAIVIGKSFHHPIENHLSILQKIIYQLQNNRPKYRQKYIQHYLNKTLISDNDIFLCSKKGYRIKEVRRLINQKNINISVLQDKISQIQETIIKSYLSELILIFSKNILDKNQSRNRIEYYANLIVSEFIFQGYTREDISNMPKHIIMGETPHQRRKRHLYKTINIRKTKKLSTQILRIDKLLRKPKMNLLYIQRINNVELFQTNRFKYNGITIVPNNNRYISSFYKDESTKEFLDFDGCFAYQKLKVNSGQVGYEIFISNLMTCLTYVNYVNRGKASIDYDNFGVQNLDMARGSKNWKNHSLSISKHKINKANNFRNIENYFTSKSGKIYLKLVTLDKVYYNALAAVNKREKVIFYWRYLESLFSYLVKNDSNIDKIDLIIKKTAQILLVDEEEHYISNVKVGLLNILINYGGKLGIDGPLSSYKFLIDRKYLNFEKLKEYRPAKNHFFVNREIKKVTNYKRSIEIDKAYFHYKGILLESYEQRNFIMHNESANEKSVIKVCTNMDLLLKRIRNTILENILCESNKRKSLEFIIENICDNGRYILNGR